MLFKRVLAVQALALGLVGLVACAAGGYAVWRAEARLQQANDRAFAVVDRGLGSVEDRVRRVQERVEQSRITTSEITHGLQKWATREAKDRLVTQLEIEARAEKLTGHIQEADLWLETSTDSVRDVQQVLEMGHSFGAEVDTASLDEAIEILASVRGRLQEAKQSVAEVRAFATPVSGESEENRLVRALKVIARVVLTISEIGPRLHRLAARISNKRADAQQVKARTSNHISWAAIGCSVIIAWIAAGQLALYVWGRNHWRRGSSPS